MWYAFRIILSWGIGIMGVVMIVGAFGADCDGKCMDNAMSISDMLMWLGYGLAAITTAICIRPLKR